MDRERQERLDKFNGSRQEPVRLAIALEEFFRVGLPEEAWSVYEAYLKRRLRPAVAALIDREDLRHLETLRTLGWMGLQQVDDGIAHARKEKRTAALIWLLHTKDQDHGWKDRDFTL